MFPWIYNHHRKWTPTNSATVSILTSTYASCISYCHACGCFLRPQNTHFFTRQWQALIGASDQYEGVKRGRSRYSSRILRLLWVAFPQVSLLTALASTRGRLLSLIRQVTNEPAAAYIGFTFKNGPGHLSGCQHERFPPHTIGIKACWCNLLVQVHFNPLEGPMKVWETWMDKKWSFYLRTELSVSGTATRTVRLMRAVLLFYTLLVSMVTGQIGVPVLCVVIKMMPW